MRAMAGRIGGRPESPPNAPFACAARDVGIMLCCAAPRAVRSTLSGMFGDNGHGALGGRVLVVEDDADLREVMAGALAGDGHVVVEAADGRAALDVLCLIVAGEDHREAPKAPDDMTSFGVRGDGGGASHDREDRLRT